MCNYNAYRALERKSESYSVSSCGVCLANFRGTGTEGKRSGDLPKKQDINAEAGTVTLSLDSQPSASLFGCTS